MPEETKKVNLDSRLMVCVYILLIGLIGNWLFEGYMNFKGLQENYPREISVTGEGVVNVKPDLALMRLGVTTENVKIETLYQENTVKMNAILAGIKSLGVEEEDIKTTSYNLTPKYEWIETTKKQVIDGYTLTQEIDVKVRDFVKIGQILEKSVASGANLVSNLEFTVDRVEAAKAEARAQAVSAAKEKAQKIMRETGLKLGRLVNFYEDNVVAYNSYYGKGGSGVSDLSVQTPVADINPGQQEIKVNVVLNYLIK